MPIPTAKELRRLVTSFDWDTWNKNLAKGFTQEYRDLVETEGAKAAASSGVEFSADDPFVQEHMTRYVGGRIVQLSKTTQKDVTRVLRSAFASADENLSPAKLQQTVLDAVRAKFTDYEAFRALRIARTESAIAYNHGGLLGHMQAGVEEFDVYDGEDDPECAEANGAVWTLDECLENPIAHPNAVFAGTRVRPIGGISAAYRARWSGPGVRVVTARGADLTISPNHPVLTGRGWIAAKFLRQGDHVVYDDRLNLENAAAPDAGVARVDLQDGEAPIEEVFEALGTIAGHTRVVAAPTHFHGDGNFCEGEVDIVGTHGPLTREQQTVLLQQARERVLVRADAQLQSLPCLGASHLGPEPIALTTSRGVGRLDVSGIRVPRSEGLAELAEPLADDAVADAALLAELAGRGTGPVSLDEIVQVTDVDAFVGHAFDLETASRSYFANGLLVHNCVRSFSPHVEDDDNASDGDDAGDE